MLKDSDYLIKLKSSGRVFDINIVTKNELEEFLIEEELTASQVAELYNVKKEKIKYLKKKLNIKPKDELSKRYLLKLFEENDLIIVKKADNPDNPD